MCKTKRFTLTLIFTITLIFSFCSCMAFGKTVTASRKCKSAPAVGTGITNVESQTSSGHTMYLKFKAPATGAYQITVSDMRTDLQEEGKDYADMFFQTASMRKKCLPVKIGRKKVYALFLQTQDSYSRSVALGFPKDTATCYLPKRNATQKFRKGKEYLLRFCTDSMGTKLVFKLEIRKLRK